MSRYPHLFRSAALGVVLLAVSSAASFGDEPGQVDFLTRIQPIFVEHCYACHGPDKQEAGLRFDQRDKALAGGDSGAWFVAGKPDESELVRRITADEGERMPPVEGGARPLSAEQIDTIKAWVAAGAPWPESKNAASTHWAYQPIARPAPPAVKNEPWVRNAIDRFVLARLEAERTSPSPEADRYTLIKRLSYDLLGLPPSIAEVDAFVNDTSPDAYERLVDRLLDSPHFGERFARHWLDKARYADSDGYEKDNPRPDAWRYRDWVIGAVNRDLPLNAFTIEQLAGDLLPGATPEQRLATAFHRQTLTNTEGGTDQEQFRVEAIFDRVATTGTVWMGLTVGCAQCHTHKYDAITHQEYYQLFAFFNNADETTSTATLVGDPLATWQRETAAAKTRLAEIEPRLEKLRAERAAGAAAWETELKNTPSEPLAYHPVELVSAKSAAEAEIKTLSDGSYLVAGKNPDVDRYTIVARSELAQVIGFRLEALPHDSLGGRGPGRTDHGNYVLGEFQVSASADGKFNKKQRVKLTYAEADYTQDGFPAASAIDGNEKTGWAVGGQTGKEHAATFFADKPIPTAKRPWLQIELSQNYSGRHTLGRFRLSAITGHDPRLGIPEKIRGILALEPGKRSAEQTAELTEYYVRRDPAVDKLAGEVETLKKRLAEEPVMNVRVLTQRASEPRKSHILARGDFLDPQAEVTPGTLSVLPPLATRSEGVADRLDLARWLVAEQNPLTRRVLVNHLWSHLFGRGIVRTMNDFGVRGERPTHPELLDWLAAELVERGWSRKDMIRLIVSSATYRQTSAHRPELAESDPLNDWFHRQNRFRVEAELVRDLTLSVSGLLSDKIGGPSVFPPMPPDIAALSYANNFKWETSPGEDRYRRGMYTFFKRTAPHPDLSTFDSPDANTTCIERRTSNTPLQSLTTLNNESFAEAAQAMAGRVLALEGADELARIEQALRLCIARPPSSEERAAFAELLSTSRAWYAEHADEAAKTVGSSKAASAPVPETAAWVATVRMMLNLDEFLTRE